MKSIFLKATELIRHIKKLSQRLTPVSILIHFLVGHSNKTQILVSLLFGFPVFLIISFFLILRLDYVSHDAFTISLVYLAAIWAWIGPVFIWRYEHVTTTKYWDMCRKVVRNKAELYKIKKSINRTIQSGFFGKLFLLIWCSLIITAFILSYDFMKGFGVISSKDIWWYIQIAGVLVYAYLTGIGFLLVIRTFLLIAKFLPLDVNIDPYHPDQEGGLGFFGGLLAETSFMFASGAFYIPVLAKLHMAQFLGNSNIILIIIGIYTLMIAMFFIVPIWFVHKKLAKEKIKRLLVIREKINNLKLKSIDWDIAEFNKYKVQRDEYLDVTKIFTWPFNTQNISTVLVSVALPIVLTTIQIYFTGK